MRMTLAVSVLVLGVVVTIAGAFAMYTHAVIADETGISGANPALWMVIFLGVGTALVGMLQIVGAVTDRPESLNSR